MIDVDKCKIDKLKVDCSASMNHLFIRKGNRSILRVILRFISNEGYLGYIG